MADVTFIPNQGSSGMDPAALMAMNGGMNNWMNNPFAYMMFMSLFNNGAFGNRGMGGGQAVADAALSGQIQNLSGQIQDNHNTDLAMGAVGNVGASVKDNGVAMNAGFDTVNSGICGVKTAIIEQGAAINLNNCQQSNLILQQAQALQNAMQNGMTQLGFQLERNACDVKETSTANTQKIIDTLTSKWQTDAAAQITQLQDKLATLEQTQALIAALGGTAAAKAAAGA